MNDDKTSVSENQHEPDKAEESYPFASEIRNFANSLDTISNALPSFISVAKMIRQTKTNSLIKFGKKHGAVQQNKDSDSVSITVPHKYSHGFRRLDRSCQQLDGLVSLLPKTAVTGAVGIYDAYLGKLLRGMFQSKPEILDSSDRKLSYKDLVTHASIDTARNYIIEKEVETVLRKSHAEQFEWLETKLGIPLRKGLDAWKDFIEITERRNLLVHTDGIVSSQYLAVCREHSVVP